MAISRDEMETGKRLCKICLEHKPLDQFRVHKHRNGPYRLRTCRVCQRVVLAEKMRIYRAIHKDEINSWAKTRRSTIPEVRERLRRQDAEKYARYREEIKAKRREYHRKYKEKIKLADACRRLRKEYSITLEEKKVMLEKQGGGCAICRNPLDSMQSANVDHCHATGQVRGILCRMCNQGLGQFRDKTDLLEVAIQYLQGRITWP